MVNTGTKLFAGVDIGATSVKIGNVAADGIIIYRVQQKLNPAELEPHDIVQFTSSLLTKLLTRMELRAQDLAGVGVGCPGVVLPGGVLHAAANFPSWSGVPLQRLLSDLIGIPVKVCNDADAAIMAEQWVGAAHGVKSFLMLILGTGVGFGVVDEGRLVRGGSNAIEGGHMIVERNGRQCGCSQRGCIEAYTSASALLREAREQLNSGVESALSSYPRDQMSVKLIFEQAAAGDKLCERLMNEAADYLGFACVTFCRILDPELIVLSGGIAEAGEAYIERIRAAYLKYSWTKFPNPVRIEKAHAGYDSGVLGAVAFLFT